MQSTICLADIEKEVISSRPLHKVPHQLPALQLLLNTRKVLTSNIGFQAYLELQKLCFLPYMLYLDLFASFSKILHIFFPFFFFFFFKQNAKT